MDVGGRGALAPSKNCRPNTKMSEERDTNLLRSAGGKSMADFSKSRQNIKAVW